MICCSKGFYIEDYQEISSDNGQTKIFYKYSNRFLRSPLDRRKYKGRNNNMAETKLLNNLKDLSKIAEEKKWTKSYDKDLDFLYWGNPDKTAAARILKISQEVFLYIDSMKNLEGIGVEYLTSNFIEHKPEYKNLPDLFTKKMEDGVFEIPSNKEGKASHEFEDFAKDLVIDVFSESLNHKQDAASIEDLANLALANN